MNEVLTTYLKNQILIRPTKLNDDLYYNNTKFTPREDYYKITKYLDDFLEGKTINRYLVLPGIRDVGKTTILFEVYEYLLKEKNINPTNILYISCDRLKKIGNIDLLEAINTYLEIYHNTILESVKEPTFLLIDEAQYDKEWSLTGKIIFDSTKNIFTIFSGSSALKLSYNADSAKRLLTIPIFPLTYSQQLKINKAKIEDNLSENIRKIIFEGNILNKNEIERKILEIYSTYPRYTPSLWKTYLEFGGFPSTNYQEENEITQKMVEMVNKVVTTDMKNIEGITKDSEELSFQILYYLAFQNPGEISHGSLANRFETNTNKISKILKILEKTQIIFHVEAFTSSATRTTKPKKYFFATSSLKHNIALDLGNAILEDEKAYLGKLLENLVASNFVNLDNRSKISYKIYYDDKKTRKNEKNVDFIVQMGKQKPIPIEVSCGKKDTGQIKKAIKKYQSPHGIIISNTTTNITKKDNIIYIPPETFSFM